ncbi:MAG: flagellar basal body L-ring protein FlgH [Phycisphaerales bacterium]|nr:flagellar basal body L-ring protein FlgH [Phycisphaerales bacterium]
MITPRLARTTAAALVLAATGAASAQSLFERGPARPAPAPGHGRPQQPGPSSVPALPAPLPAAADSSAPSTPPSPPTTPAPLPPGPAQKTPAQAPVGAMLAGSVRLSDVSLTSVEAPKPKEFKENDLITIIISEKASSSRTQNLKTDKKYDLNAELKNSIDLLQILEARLVAGRQSGDPTLPQFTLGSSTKFDGKGEYKSEQQTTARVTARVLEVKPNGTILLESRTRVKNDEEDQTIILSGIARTQDVTISNTIQSNQLFDLNLAIENKGQVRDTATKGIIPRVLETLFNF